MTARNSLKRLVRLLFAGSPPTAARHLTGLSSTEDTSYDVRIDDDRERTRRLAASHGADPAMFPYDIHGPRT